MEKISFFATLDQYQELELSFCAELPAAIHMVKIYPEEGIELFFDGSVEWTDTLVREAENILLGNLIYA
jgi:hypothetical protein